MWNVRLFFKLCITGQFFQRELLILQSLSLKLEDELRKTRTDPREPESEVARRNAEKRLFGSVGMANQSDRIRQEMARYASMRDPSLRLIYTFLHTSDFNLPV